MRMLMPKKGEGGRLVLLISLGLLAGCGSGHAPMDFQVELSPYYLAIAPIERRPRPDCEELSWAGLGECTLVDDVIRDCDPEPGECLKQVRLLRDGEVLAERPATLAIGRLYFEFTDPLLDTTAPMELELVGCGSRWRVPLPTGRADPLAITGLHHTRDRLTVEVESDQAIEAIKGTLSGWVEANICVSSGGDQIELPVLAPDWDEWQISLYPIVAQQTFDDPDGTIEVRLFGDYRHIGVSMPWPDADGLLEVPIAESAIASASVDGTSFDAVIDTLQLKIQVADQSPDVTLTARLSDPLDEQVTGMLQWRGGADGGQVDLQMVTGQGAASYSGASSAVVIDNPPVFGKGQSDAVSVSLGPADLSGVEDPQASVQVELEVWARTPQWVSAPILDP